MANRAFPGTDRNSAASPKRSGEGGRCGGYTLRSMGIHEYQAGSVKAALFRPTPRDRARQDHQWIPRKEHEGQAARRYAASFGNTQK
jgi:hypothetical protein